MTSLLSPFKAVHECVIKRSTSLFGGSNLESKSFSSQHSYRKFLQRNPSSPFQLKSSKSKKSYKFQCKARTVENESLPSSLKDTITEIENRSDENVLRLAVICGGPSEERGISLNSARSIFDHLKSSDIEMQAFYFDKNLKAYAIPTSQMYSNTPSDFDFKLKTTSIGFDDHDSFLSHLKKNFDIVFPAMHGKFGEDGEIQRLLESAGIPFVGSSSKSATMAFDKVTSSTELSKRGFATFPSFLYEEKEGIENLLSEWFKNNGLDLEESVVVAKPARAGSSIGVHVSVGYNELVKNAQKIILEKIDDRVIIESFVDGKEFTGIVLEGKGNNKPITLLPTEVELKSNDDESNAIFSYRRKYLPTRQVSYHTPPRFSENVLNSIREGASKVFEEMNLNDIARIDGWFVPKNSKTFQLIIANRTTDKKFVAETDEGLIVFSDINIVSGMEQSSFLFQQAAQVGLSHSSILRHIIFSACQRNKINFSKLPAGTQSIHKLPAGVQSLASENDKKKVYVLFGGTTSERQVSLMSGTNVWLKLLTWQDLEVTPFLLTGSDSDTDHQKSITENDKIEDSHNYSLEDFSVWNPPYFALLNHTVEEVNEVCERYFDFEKIKFISFFQKKVIQELESNEIKVDQNIINQNPKKIKLLEWIKNSKENNAIVFLAVHGGIGENGTLQNILEENNIPFTGPGKIASEICMNKVITAEKLHGLEKEGIFTASKKVFASNELFPKIESKEGSEKLWVFLTTELNSHNLCVKPASDGCSTGVAKLCSSSDLEVYISAVKKKLVFIPPNSLSTHGGILEMSNPSPSNLLFEPFIETDSILIADSQSKSKSTSKSTSSEDLIWEGKSRWIEVTVGVFGKRNEMISFNPSITVKESGEVLSLEEKFQGGTGVNLTPPPLQIVNQQAIENCKKRIAIVAKVLKLEGFSRIDAFLNVDNGEVLIIEVNTVPGMTPSTVIFHQALAENPPMEPRAFLHNILEHAITRFDA